jgi:hypothetical protein
MSKKLLDSECKKVTSNKNVILECLNTKIFPDEQTIKNVLEKVNENNINHKKDVLNMFNHFGYIPSKNDILLMAKYNIESIRFTESFLDDENFKKEIDDIFYETGYFMYGIKPSLKYFKKFLKSSKYNENAKDNYCYGHKSLKCPNLSKVKKFVEDNNIIPDLECLKIVCGLPLSGDVVRYFIEELKIEPDFDCISSCHHADKTIKYLVDLFKNKK